VAHRDVGPDSGKTWSLRLFDAVPLPPIWVGALIGLGFFVLYLAYTWAFGVSLGILEGAASPIPFGAEIILALMIGFAPAVTTYTLRGRAATDSEIWAGGHRPPLHHPSDAALVTLRGGGTRLLARGSRRRASAGVRPAVS
jgi:hypothetical protein